MDIQFVIWGTGIRGDAAAKVLGSKRIRAFIDSDDSKVGTIFREKPVISFSEYLERYRESFIVVSPLFPEEIIKILEEHEVYRYFLLNDCPSELQGYGVTDILERIPVEFEPDKCSAVYGITLFGVLLYEFLVNRGCAELYLLPQENLDENVLEAVKESYDFCRIADLEGVGDRIDKVFTAVETDGRFWENADFCVEDAFDFSDRFKDYYNPEIARFKNSAPRSRCFIVATGPSLRMEDLDRLYRHGEICLSMNRIYAAFAHTQWRPDYYMVQDRKIMEYDGEEICRLEASYKFISDNFPPFWEEERAGNIFKCHAHTTPRYPAKPGFSENFAQKNYVGATVTYACIQLAVYMGFREIYLLGVDFSYRGDVGSEDNHFYGGAGGANEKLNPFFPRENYLAYCTAKEYADGHGIKIYNATRGGKLEVFERKNFDELFPD